MENLLLRKKTSMEKEIHQQPLILSKILKSFLTDNNEITLEVPDNIKKIVLVASGSSYHCARYGADLFGQVADMEARAIYSSEFLLKPKVPSLPAKYVCGFSGSRNIFKSEPSQASNW